MNVRLEYAVAQCPEDKPYIESFFGSYKTEELYRNEYNSLAEARTEWESYRDWYCNDRLHQALWYKSPRDYAKVVCNRWPDLVQFNGVHLNRDTTLFCKMHAKC